jgi:hypothetical protein
MPESLPGTVDVVRWVPVAPSWMGHRAEPLIHERMWACPLELAGDQLAYDGRLHEAGFDVAGRPVVLRRSLPWLQPHDEIETVEYREREIVVTLPGATVATTTIDDHGRPLRTVYSGAEAGEETYQYDDAGRLAAIDEADCLWMTVSFCEWDRTGGCLAVEHDGAARCASPILGEASAGSDATSRGRTCSSAAPGRSGMASCAWSATTAARMRCRRPRRCSHSRSPTSTRARSTPR